ncbi:glycoside hydrolase [Pterulicium gracile]|uniref:Alpha-amylase n=1 Tax=Pterulicium gracile TaxID=1884261 RepID=A0A5C3QXD3_9AGAR|nr:glycoside hydrolase [Pterula gracilis]
MRNFGTLLASVLLAAGFTSASPVAAPAPHNVTLNARQNPTEVIIQMFGWSWDSIAAECEAFIGPAGYSWVQVSPPQEHITGGQWWTEYQPVSYKIQSKRGNRSQFQNMVSRCRNSGVRIIADAVINHMSAINSGTGVGGSSFSQFNYPGIYQRQDFHTCNRNGNNDIMNYNDRYEVQNCELNNLADLATESDYVRGKIAAYLNDLLSLGVEGLRIDAAKHIPTGDISNILSRLSRVVYITQEVIFGPGEPILPSEYTRNGDVQEFRYTYTLRDAFLGGTINNLRDFSTWGWVAGGQANAFVANHDTERDHFATPLKYDSPNNAYVLAHVFSLAHPYGQPSVLSGYSWSNFDTGAPDNGAGRCSGSGGSGGWLCQHRWLAISAMVGFRRTVGTAALNNWQSPANNRIAFGRGTTGFVAINRATSAWTGTFTTSLPNGSYCDVISGNPVNGACSGFAVNVSGGRFTATIPALSALAVHTGARGTGTGGGNTPPPASGTVAVNFRSTATTVLGENIFVVGSLAQLGAWNPDAAVALSSASYPVWTGTVNVAPNTEFQYKFLRKGPNGVQWTSDPNFTVRTPASGSQTLNDSWR